MTTNEWMNCESMDELWMNKWLAGWLIEYIHKYRLIEMNECVKWKQMINTNAWMNHLMTGSMHDWMD